jgi:hypothetical protein
MDDLEPGQVMTSTSSLFEATNVEDVEQAVILRAHASSRTLGFSFPETFPCEATSLGHCLQKIRREIQKLARSGEGERLDFVRVKEQMIMHLQQKGTDSTGQAAAEAEADASAAGAGDVPSGGPPQAPAESRRAELIRKGLLTPFDDMETDEELISKGLMTPLDSMAGQQQR